MKSAPAGHSRFPESPPAPASLFLSGTLNRSQSSCPSHWLRLSERANSGDMDTSTLELSSQDKVCLSVHLFKSLPHPSVVDSVGGSPLNPGAELPGLVPSLYPSRGHRGQEPCWGAVCLQESLHLGVLIGLEPPGLSTARCGLAPGALHLRPGRASPSGWSVPALFCPNGTRTRAPYGSGGRAPPRCGAREGRASSPRPAGRWERGGRGASARSPACDEGPQVTAATAE